MDRALEDTIPTFNKKESGGDDGVSLSGGLASLAASGGRTRLEIAVIILVAVVIIGGAELLLGYFKVPQYVLPKPSLIVMALFSEWPFIWPHLLTTLYELLVGFAIGGAIGFVLAAVITQFPFVEKIETPGIVAIGGTQITIGLAVKESELALCVIGNQMAMSKEPTIGVLFGNIFLPQVIMMIKRAERNMEVLCLP